MTHHDTIGVEDLFRWRYKASRGPGAIRTERKKKEHKGKKVKQTDNQTERGTSFLSM